MCRVNRLLQRLRIAGVGLLAMILMLASLGCSQKMDRQPRLEPLEESDFFIDGMGSRPVVPNTVARGESHFDDHYLKGKVEGQLAADFPQDIQDGNPREVLTRGQERFDIFCAPCHDRVGSGQGMVVRRGFPRPPSLHSARLREAPIGHLFDVVSNGIGRMPAYNKQISTEDRWAIVAYVRALQFSQNAPAEELNDDDRTKLTEVNP